MDTDESGTKEHGLCDQLRDRIRKLPDNPWGFEVGKKRGLEEALDLAEPYENRLKELEAVIESAKQSASNLSDDELNQHSPMLITAYCNGASVQGEIATSLRTRLTAAEEALRLIREYDGARWHARDLRKIADDYFAAPPVVDPANERYKERRDHLTRSTLIHPTQKQQDEALGEWIRTSPFEIIIKTGRLKSLATQAAKEESNAKG